MDEFKFGDRVIVKNERKGIVIRIDNSYLPLQVAFPEEPWFSWLKESEVRLDPDYHPEAKPEPLAIPDKWEMRVTPEESKQVQERLFQLGYKWAGAKLK